MLVALGAFSIVQAQPSTAVSENSEEPTQAKVEEITLKQGDENDVLFVQEEKNEEEVKAAATAALESFSMALQAKSYLKIDEYLQKGFNINHVLYDGNTIVQISAFHRDLDLLFFISERKANLSNLNKNGESILYWGATGKSVQYLEEAKALLGKEFDSLMAKKTKTGRTPLHAAVLHAGNLDVINWLISNKADIKAKDVNGQTAMHYAVAIRSWDVLEVLLKRGGTLTEVDNEGKSVEEYLFEKLDVLTIDRFHTYVSPDKKTLIEKTVVTFGPEKAMQLNPQIKLTYEQKMMLGKKNK